MTSAAVTKVLTSAGTMTQDLSKMLDPEGKDITQIIMEEHRLVEALAERYRTEVNPKEREGIAHNIVKLLSVHAACEEASVYPMVKKVFPNGAQIAQQYINDHHEVKEDLYKLDKMSIGDDGYDNMIMKAIRDNSHHVQVEESDLLPRLKQLCTAEQMQEMRKEFLKAKSMAPSRPHPSAPSEPPQNKIAAAAMAPVDAARDVGRFS